jgi:hypothetical protein
MIVCICRDIRESHYDNREDLIKRVLEEDYCCGKCLDEFILTDDETGISNLDDSEKTIDIID